MIRIGRGPRQWIDRAIWTGTGIALGFGLAILAVGVFIPWEQL